VIVVLPHDTIRRILERADAVPGAASNVRRRRTQRPTEGKAGPILAQDIIHALNRAKKDKASIVGPLEPSSFNDLSAWCRSAGLVEDGEIVEAAVRASG
jgi:hypothetical protein